jgi:hypothetical protein
MKNPVLIAYRREYVEAECEEAGLTPAQTELAIAAAMSVDDDMDPDDFELMVGHVIEGAADSEVP